MASGSAKIMPVYAIIGDSPFLKRAALDAVLASLSHELDELGPSRFDGANASAVDVLDEARTPSLLAARRAVIVDDADPFITANRKLLERYCESPVESASLILVVRSLPRNQKIHKAIVGIGTVIACDPPRGRGVPTWIVDRAQRTYGKRISVMTARILRDHVGEAPGQLDAELAKLTAYVGERAEIVADDVSALVGNHREEKVFAIMGAISANDTSEALRQWEQVLSTDRAAPALAIGGLAWSVREFVEARRNWDAGAGIGASAARMRVDPDALRQRIQGFSASRLDALQRDLHTVELDVKNGLSTIGLGIEKFIVKNSTERGAIR